MKLLKINIFIIIIIIIGWILYLVVFPKIKVKEITLPDLRNYSLNDAISFLNNNKLKYKIIESDYSDIPSIINTFPSGNTSVKKGSTVKLYVSLPIDSKLNDYTNTMYKDSIDEINEYILAKGYILKEEYVVRNDISEGLIIDQREEMGIITITIAKKSDIYLSNYIGLNILDVIDELSNLNITLKYVSSPVDFNIILKQSVYNKNIKENNNSEIIFYLSKGI
ncbi:MAG: PASTA domain-containing protein [Anaeroplasmataceae bacterium]